MSLQGSSDFTKERARTAANCRWAKVKDRTEATRPARTVFDRRFQDEPDPEAARRAYYRRLALRRWHPDKEVGN